MSVRMALVKLSALAAGGAVVGGGAVHVAEAPAAKVQYVKQAKAAPARVAKRKIVRTAAAEPRKMKRIRRVVTKTVSCAPAAEPQQIAMAMPALPQLPQMPMPSGGGDGGPVVMGLSGFPCVGGHNGQEGVPLCPDARNR